MAERELDYRVEVEQHGPYVRIRISPVPCNVPGLVEVGFEASDKVAAERAIDHALGALRLWLVDFAAGRRRS